MKWFASLLLLSLTCQAQGPSWDHSPDTVADWMPPDYDTSQIIESEALTFQEGGAFWTATYFQNRAYECGLSGYHSFLVVERADKTGGDAPLWVYLHGGSMGYFDEDGAYFARIGQTKDTWNHEEGLVDLLDILGARTAPGATLSNRMRDGYRLLIPSMCDHDLYLGQGTPYPHNPGREVNGLQATQAALAYAQESYDNSATYVHGTSAGSIGGYALILSAERRGWQIDAGVLDSAYLTPILWPVFERLRGKAGFPFGDDFQIEGLADKIGQFMDPAFAGLLPENQLASGLIETPLLFIMCQADAFCGGQSLPISSDVTNCMTVTMPLEAAIQASDEQHYELYAPRDGRHVPTVRPGPANLRVDMFLSARAGW